MRMLKNAFEVGFWMIIAAATALNSYWYWQRPAVGEIERRILTPAVQPGDVLRIEISRTRHPFDCRASVHRRIIDGAGIEYPLAARAQPGGTRFVIETIVPPGAVPGPAAYLVKIEYVCNPLQRFVPFEINRPALQFQILDPVPSLGKNQSYYLQIPQMKAGEAARKIAK